MGIISQRFTVACAIAAIVSIAVMLREGTSDETTSFVIGGNIKYEDGTPANGIEIWLKAISGKVSTRITKTQDGGRFSFTLPPPIAGRFKLLVHPYGIEYSSLAPAKQEISIVIPKHETKGFADYVKSLPDKNKLRLLLNYEEFFIGIDEKSDDNTLIFQRWREEMESSISEIGESVSLEFNKSSTSSPSRIPWYFVRKKL